MSTTTWTSGTPGAGAYAEVNGISLYYETHGAGRPLVLLHGGLGSGEMFGPILPALSERHLVITPDLQGHGRTADIDRPLDVRLMADDIAALIDHLPDGGDLCPNLHYLGRAGVKKVGGLTVAFLSGVFDGERYFDVNDEQRKKVYERHYTEDDVIRLSQAAAGEGQ